MAKDNNPETKTNSKLSANIRGGLNEKNEFSGSFEMEAPQRQPLSGSEKALLIGGTAALVGCGIKAVASGFNDVAGGVQMLRSGETL